MQIIKALRKEEGTTQRQLSEKLGVSVSSVRAYENQMDMAPFDILLKLSAIFQVSLDYLVGRQDEAVLSNFRRLPSAQQKVFNDLLQMLAEKSESHQ